MTAVISVPSSLDEQSFEHVIAQLADVPASARVLLDARNTRWASPYGLVSLLCAAQSREERMQFAAPENPDTLSYWSRAGFFRYAAELFDIAGAIPRSRESQESSVLLEITPITGADDVHGVVGRVNQKAAEILQGQLNLEPAVVGSFVLTLSEACQNIVEHAEKGGWVAVQRYRYTKRLGRRVVQIAVCDAGIGFRRSLESSPSHMSTGRWGDDRALEEAVLHSHSRHRMRDSGRGQGLAGIRGFIGRHNAKLTVRSGTARLAIYPKWDEDIPLQKDLPFFPGAQVQVMVPERLEGETSGLDADRASGIRPRGRNIR